MARKKKSDVAVRENYPLDTTIGSGSFFEGTMKAEKSVRIDGIFKGELYCSGFLVINQSSEVDAQIEGMDVYINGVGYSGSVGPADGTVSNDGVITWSSDSAIVRGGWLLCYAEPGWPPPSPPPSPPSPPSLPSPPSEPLIAKFVMLISIVTDNYPSEISWQLTDSTSVTLSSGGATIGRRL